MFKAYNAFHSDILISLKMCIELSIDFIYSFQVQFFEYSQTIPWLSICKNSLNVSEKKRLTNGQNLVRELFRCSFQVFAVRYYAIFRPSEIFFNLTYFYSLFLRHISFPRCFLLGALNRSFMTVSWVCCQSSLMSNATKGRIGSRSRRGSV